MSLHIASTCSLFTYFSYCFIYSRVSPCLTNRPLLILWFKWRNCTPLLVLCVLSVERKCIPPDGNRTLWYRHSTATPRRPHVYKLISITFLWAYSSVLPFVNLNFKLTHVVLRLFKWIFGCGTDAEIWEPFFVYQL